MKILYITLLALTPWCASAQQYVSMPAQPVGIQPSNNIIGEPQLFVSKHKFTKRLFQIIGIRQLHPAIKASVDSTLFQVNCVIRTMTLTQNGILRDEILQCVKVLEEQGKAGMTTFTTLVATASMLAAEAKPGILVDHNLFVAPINDASGKSLGHMVVGLRKGHIASGERDWEFFSIHVKNHCDNPQHHTENGCVDFLFNGCIGLEGVPEGTKFFFLSK